MNGRVITRGLAMAVFALGLAGCGGGGGAGGSVGSASTTVSGVATFDYVPNADGALDYAATRAKPIRGALVEVFDATTQAVVATAVTDGAGSYSAMVPADTQLKVRVKAQLKRSDASASWDVTVRDNTQSNAIYAMESPAFAAGHAGASRSLHAPSGWGGASYTSQRVAAPFAILDTVFISMNKVASAAAGLTFPPLRVMWSKDNREMDGLVNRGEIGTTSYSNDLAGPVIYVLGKEDVDTDEYDESVIAHEWGHYYQNAFSRDDSPGGSHGGEERLDRRLAFSEGWSNAWSGIALERASYTDSAGPGQVKGTAIALNAGSASRPGWYKEASIEAIIWNLNSHVGFRAIHDAMAGPQRTTPAVTSIHSFAAALMTAAPWAWQQLAPELVRQAISSGAADPWGALESNDGGLPEVLPLYRPARIGVPTSACVTSAAGLGNALGSFVYLRVPVPASGVYRISATGPAGSDPDFSVFAGAKLASSDGLGTSETALVALPAGDVVVALNDANGLGASTLTPGSTCFNVTIN